MKKSRTYSIDIGLWREYFANELFQRRVVFATEKSTGGRNVFIRLDRNDTKIQEYDIWVGARRAIDDVGRFDISVKRILGMQFRQCVEDLLAHQRDCMWRQWTICLHLLPERSARHVVHHEK